ncbi:hypothetical protein BHU11_01645 [Tannerella sp. oral taxon 808]|nr:hypothetical protein BHU11_01645 [Tannerella sp. oral taxon 808]
MLTPKGRQYPKCGRSFRQRVGGYTFIYIATRPPPLVVALLMAYRQLAEIKNWRAELTAKWR